MKPHKGKVEEIDKSVSNWNVIPQPIALAPIQSSSSSAANLPINVYPPPLAKYEDLVGNPKLFMDTLQKLHHAMATKFMIPIIGGRDLDLHKLFVEVTTRGGIERILREKKWKDVTATFNFPSTATNASFILRKHYFSLLHHYEQIYYFKAQGWSTLPNAAASWQSGYAIPIAIHGGINTTPVLNPAPVPSPAPIFQPQVIRPAEPAPEEFLGTAPPVNSQVTGVIDGKFENGYFVTVTIGERELKGVLYHSAKSIAQLDHCLKSRTTENLPKQGNINVTSVTPPVTKLRRRRRKKSEIKRRDPAHPKPNRSGYNFFFAEQHARLKPLYQGRDREISRIIGELWTNIKEDEKAVYQEKAVNDKERYRKEMEGYRERLRLGQVISNAVPIQQRLPNLDAKLAEVKEVAEKDYSEAFEDEEDDDEEEEDDEYSMSMSEYEEDAEEPLEDLNIEASKKAEPMIQSSNGVDQCAIQEAAEAALMLSKSNQMAVEEARETQEQEHEFNAVSEDQQAKASTA
ncbi:hypothetical protein V2J09_014356 [Rumex salicifolius]